MSDHDAKALLTNLVRRLQSDLPELIAVYRFGSFGTPEERADSDIDLGLQTASPPDPVDLFHLAGELATMAGRDVDLVDMIGCSTVMRARIVATGELVFCRDPYLCEDFATMAFSRYAHFNEARRGILEDIQTTGSIYGR